MQLEIMKKLIATLFAAVVLLSLSGCAGGNANSPTLYGNATYSITFGDDFFDAATATVYFIENDEVQKRDLTAASLNGHTWSRTVSSGLPANYGFRLVITPKAESDLTLDSYALYTTGQVSIVTNTGSGTTFQGNPVVIVGTATAPRAQVASVLSKASGTVVGYSMDEDGEVTVNNNIFK